LNTHDDRDFEKLMLSICGSKKWAERMWEHRPYLSAREMFTTAEDAWWGLDTRDWLEAYAAHPRIGGGGGKKAGKKEKREQAGVEGADQETVNALKRLNDEYFKKHGFIFIVFATGKSAGEMLELLEDRLKN